MIQLLICWRGEKQIICQFNLLLSISSMTHLHSSAFHVNHFPLLLSSIRSLFCQSFSISIYDNVVIENCTHIFLCSCQLMWTYDWKSSRWKSTRRSIARAFIVMNMKYTSCSWVACQWGTTSFYSGTIDWYIEPWNVVGRRKNRFRQW